MLFCALCFSQPEASKQQPDIGSLKPEEPAALPKVPNLREKNKLINNFSGISQAACVQKPLNYPEPHNLWKLSNHFLPLISIFAVYSRRKRVVALRHSGT